MCWQVNRAFRDSILAPPIQHEIDLYAAGLGYNPGARVSLTDSREALRRYLAATSLLHLAEPKMMIRHALHNDSGWRTRYLRGFDPILRSASEEYYIKNGKSGTNRPSPSSGVLLFLSRGRHSCFYRDARVAVSAPVLRPALQTHFDAVATYGSEFI